MKFGAFDSLPTWARSVIAVLGAFLVGSLVILAVGDSPTLPCRSRPRRQETSSGRKLDED